MATAVLGANTNNPVHPVQVASRIGDSKVALMDGFSSLMLVLRTITLFAPLRFFVGIGAFLFVVGAVYGLITAVALGLGLPVAALLLLNAGMLLGMLGLIADQISQIRLRELERNDQDGSSGGGISSG